MCPHHASFMPFLGTQGLVHAKQALHRLSFHPLGVHPLPHVFFPHCPASCGLLSLCASFFSVVSGPYCALGILLGGLLSSSQECVRQVRCLTQSQNVRVSEASRTKMIKANICWPFACCVLSWGWSGVGWCQLWLILADIGTTVRVNVPPTTPSSYLISRQK